MVNTSFHHKIIDFKGEKIGNHHMGNYRHIDMFSRTECHPEIDSARLEFEKAHLSAQIGMKKCLFNGECEFSR